MPRAPKGIGMLIGCMMPETHQTPVEKPFPTPADVKAFAGEGASEQDIRRGYKDPDIESLPEYDRKNYEDRLSQPENDQFVENMEFRSEDRASRGFLTRSRYPYGER